ncbi:MAG: diacylglycerol kinase family lipid kinase [Ruminococcaceae bacterium]|nr:diacylglycerol kinase family lipid kinase [Oscillospiraceae bacterium]
MKTKKVFLINSFACSDKIDNIKESIKKAMAGEEYEIIESQKPGHISEAVKSYSNSTVFSVGGDGTLLETVNGAAQTDNEIFVVPAGSGNDFCRVLTDERDYQKVLLDIKAYSPKTVDCGKAGNTYFANIASVGYDAEIVKNASKFKDKPLLRKFSYILSIFYTLFTFKPLKLKLTIDGVVYEQKFLLAAFANGQYYGGGIHIAPTAIIDDGYLDVYLADAMNKFQILMILPKLLNGSHVNHPKVKIIKAKKIEVSSESPFLLNLDGDLSDCCGTEISIIENGITYYCKK